MYPGLRFRSILADFEFWLILYRFHIPSTISDSATKEHVHHWKPKQLDDFLHEQQTFVRKKKS